MNQAERDRLDALKRAKKKLITQQQAAQETGVTERQVRRLLRKLRQRGDRAENCGAWRDATCGRNVANIRCNRRHLCTKRTCVWLHRPEWSGKIELISWV